MCGSSVLKDRHGRAQISLERSNPKSGFSAGGRAAECVPRVRLPIEALREHSNLWCRLNAHKDFHRHRSRVVGFSQRSKREQVRTPSSTRECRMDSEKELLEAFERIIHEDFP